jgi:hypothetical protein
VLQHKWFEFSIEPLKLPEQPHFETYKEKRLQKLNVVSPPTKEIGLLVPTSKVQSLSSATSSAHSPPSSGNVEESKEQQRPNPEDGGIVTKEEKKKTSAPTPGVKNSQLLEVDKGRRTKFFQLISLLLILFYVMLH